MYKKIKCHLYHQKSYNHFYDVFLIIYSYEVEPLTTCPRDMGVPAVS